MISKIVNNKIQYGQIRHALSRAHQNSATYYNDIGVPTIFEALKQLSEFNLKKAEEWGGSIASTGLSRSDENNVKGNGTEYSDIYHPTATNTLYKVWSLAVNEEMDLFNRFSEFAARTDDEETHSWLLTVCRDALGNARSFRQKRRVAFHIERPHRQNTEFPKWTRVGTVVDFTFTVSAVENWITALMERMVKDFPQIEVILTDTRKKINELNRQLDGYPIPKQLRKSLSALNNAEISNFADGISPTQKILNLIAECERVFDYYDLIFSAVPDKQVMEEAQSMCAFSLRRLQQLRSLKF